MVWPIVAAVGTSLISAWFTDSLPSKKLSREENSKRIRNIAIASVTTLAAIGITSALARKG